MNPLRLLGGLLLLVSLSGPAVYAAPSCVEFVVSHKASSRALQDPLIEEARTLKAFDDFKPLSDLSPKRLSSAARRSVRQEARAIELAQGRTVAVRFLVESLYELREELLPVSEPSLSARWTVRNPRHRATFEHIERMWSVLTRRTPPSTESSLIPLPNPFLIPGARFQEGYYWDSYFAFPSLLATGRETLVKGQIDNFLFLIKNYGLIPNGTRDYYLSRSQPPLIARMARLYVEHLKKKGPLSAETLKWLKEDAYPLIKKDYESFWMNPATRLDSRTGLNHHYDSLNTPRPERHASDQEENLGRSYRDVRAEAESGKDFTAAFEGQAASYAGVMLNSILYGVERDLAWMAGLLGRAQEGLSFEAAARKRRRAMNRYMWDASTGLFRDYNLQTQTQSPVVTADIFLALDFQVATQAQAQSTVAQLGLLERAGGLMSSNVRSGKQWDAPYGWAPHHYFAINGMLKYGYRADAHRLARKWVQTVDRIYQRTGKILEKIDAETGDVPMDGDGKYPTQDGFLWTNGVYVWALNEILGAPMVRSAP